MSEQKFTDILGTGLTPSNLEQRTRNRETGLDRLFRKEIENAFLPVRGWQSNNDKLSDLVKYGEQLGEKFTVLNTQEGLLPAFASRYLSMINPEDIPAGFSSVVLRLQQETSYLKELEDVGIASALLVGLDKGRYKAFVKFINPDSFFARLLNSRKGVTAAYNFLTDTAYVFNKPPTEKEMWLMLATAGRLPKVVSDLNHELTHDLQWSGLQRTVLTGSLAAKTGGYFYVLLKHGFLKAQAFNFAAEGATKILNRPIKNDTLLDEIHSYESEASDPSSGEADHDDALETARHVIDSYKVVTDEVYVGIDAYESIRTLRLLGLNDEEIGNTIRMAKLDKKRGKYPKLEQRVNLELEKWGVGAAYFPVIRKALVARQDLELRVQRQQAQRIAADELMIAAGEKSWLKIPQYENT